MNKPPCLSLLARCLILAIPCLWLSPGIALAQDATPGDLQRQLQQRDQVILELLERVESLEQRLGVEPASTGSDTGNEQSTAEVNASNTSEAKQAPGMVVADEAMAERALERSLTRSGALLLPAGVFEIEPSLVYVRQEESVPGFVTSGSGVMASEVQRNSDTLSAGLLLRAGLPGDAQLEIGVPYRWRRIETVTSVGFSPVQRTSQSGSATGDVRIALAKTLLRKQSGQPDIVGRLSWDTDSGNPDDNGVSLGSGYTELGASLSFIKRQAPVVFVSGLSYQHTLEKDSIQPGDTIGASFGSYLALNPQTSMNISLSLAYQQETKFLGTAVRGSDRVIGNLNIGGSSLVARGTLVNLTVGIGLTEDASDFSVALSVPVRF